MADESLTKQICPVTQNIQVTQEMGVGIGECFDDPIIILLQNLLKVDLLYKMFIVVKCVYNKPVISHFKYDRLIENVIRILVIVHFTF